MLEPARGPGYGGPAAGSHPFEERFDAMTRNSKTALLAALMLGTGGVAMLAVPAGAAKKKEEPASDAKKLSPAFQKPALEAQTKLKANDLAGAEAALAQAEAAAQSDYENYIAGQFRLSLEQSKLKAASGGDPAKYSAGASALVPPLNKLIANPQTAPEDKARYLEVRGNIYYDAHKYSEAAADYVAARDAGSTSSDIGLQIMRSKGEAGDIDGAAAELKKMIDAKPAGEHVPDTWYRYILAKVVKAKRADQAVYWSRELVKAYPTAENWRQAIGVYASSVAPTVRLDARQRIDLLRLLRAANALADENDYNEYAQATDSIGLFDETLALIDEGAKNGKLPSKNSLSQMIRNSSTTGRSLEKPLPVQEAAAKAAKTGDLATQTADSYLGRGEYAKAAELYQVALSKGFEKPSGAPTKRHFIDNDEVNTHLGIALALAGDKQGARTAFNAVAGSPRKDIVSFWLTWLDVGAKG